MTLSFANRSNQHALVIGCVVIALLALPFSSVLHCEVAQAADGDASATLAEACCVFLCLTILVGILMIQPGWMAMTRVTRNLKPVCLTIHLTRWVPPPRPIGSLA
jgi:hypothetical protein